MSGGIARRCLGQGIEGQSLLRRLAGDAEYINKQACKERIDWINKQKNKQATNGFLSSAPVGGARAA